jgi:hypothetical protein
MIRTGLRLCDARDCRHAAAPDTRCRKFRRGSFILSLPLPSHHSITSSARSRIDVGMVMPSDLAVFRVYHQLEASRLLDRQVCWLGALEDTRSIGSDLGETRRRCRLLSSSARRLRDRRAPCRWQASPRLSTKNMWLKSLMSLLPWPNRVTPTPEPYLLQLLNTRFTMGYGVSQFTIMFLKLGHALQIGAQSACCQNLSL